jgi:hypothetical protein
MQWPSPDEIRSLCPLPRGYHIAVMTRDDIPLLIASIRAWFPGVTVGQGSLYLSEAFYRDNVTLGDDPDRNVIVLLIWDGNELAAFGSWERESAALTLYARLGAVAPAHRGAGLAIAAMQLGERLGRAMGAGFIYTLATMKTPHMQLALERAGYQLIGFMPGYDREETAPGVVRRVFEAGYAKRLAPAEEFLRPEDRNMTPQVRRLFDIMFPAESVSTAGAGPASAPSNRSATQGVNP